ncbi:MAG: transcriptional repressor [Oscillospiraceae bacterium]|nr:transcriptional repressor [Oscillospiraceae bacterium]
MEVKRKNSKKRTAILNALSSVKDHPTAEMLYAALKPEIPELSLGTVYRNLSILADEGLVVNVAHVAGQERYDARTDPHAHFVCKHCGQVIDVELPDMMTPLYAQVSEETGCVAESYKLSFNGLCENCNRKLTN